MTLPEKAFLCDAIEMAALCTGLDLSNQDLAKQLYPSQKEADVNAVIREALELGKLRSSACGSEYPFSVDSRRISFNHSPAFNPYLFLLLGRALNFGGPVNCQALICEFRSKFEDLVCWTLQRANFVAVVLSEPRAPRGLHRKLPDALKQIAAQFRLVSAINLNKISEDDNDLDVDVLAVPIVGNQVRGSWPTILIQCATGEVKHLQSKVDEGANTFPEVWEHGFHRSNCVRGGATPFDLLSLHPIQWDRLTASRWILDRTRLVYLASRSTQTPVPTNVQNMWSDLWIVRNQINWQMGWQE